MELLTRHRGGAIHPACAPGCTASPSCPDGACTRAATPLMRPAEASTDVGADDVPAARPGGSPRLTGAGKFWLAYVAGIVSALLLVHWGAR